jgi:putative addiction module CopG family antidote
MAVTLSPELQARIEAIALGGDYGSAEEVLDMALTLLEDREEKLRWLQHELDKGLKSLEESDYSTRSIDEILADARARYQRGRKRA